jgi:hypothetical protein
MILNKFSPISVFQSIKALSLQLLALSLFSCNKSANINANKSFVGVTHVAYGVGPITVSLDGTPLFTTPLGFGFTTGDSLNPYDTATSRISDMVIRQDTATLLNGNAAFQQGEHYSVFVFDSLTTPPVSLIIFQDDPIVRTDTFTYIRYLNFSPNSSWALRLLNARRLSHIPVAADTITIGPSASVGYNLNPGYYHFTQVRVGNYDVIALRDSAKPAADSSNVKPLGPLRIDSSTNYNVYLQGFTGTDTGQNKFQLKSVPLN